MSDNLKIPPHNIEAEQSLLGAILIDKDAIIKIADIVTPTDFYNDNHRDIFQAILDLYSRHEPIDLLSLGNHLEELKKLDTIGGQGYLVTLANTVPTASHVLHYGNIIAKKATLRRLIRAAADINELGFTEAEDVSQLLDSAEQKLFNVSQNFLKQGFIPIRNILSDTFERIDELHRDKGKLRGISTGFPALDNILAGLQRSDLVILAARPSVGKTSLALDIARNVAVRSKLPVAIFSLEMSKEQVVDRLLCTEAGVDLWRMRTGKLSDDPNSSDFPRIGQAIGVLSEAPIYIDDSANLNVMELRTKARRLHMEHNLGLIVIDYLQLMDGQVSTENRVQEISLISRSLKSIARELNIPVLALSQLARAVELNKPAIPKLAHLRESGSIEQDADVVMFIYRKSADKNYRIEEIPEDQKNLAEIYIAKHRNGPTGVVPLFFNAQKVSFETLSREYKPSDAPPSSREEEIPAGF